MDGGGGASDDAEAPWEGCTTDEACDDGQFCTGMEVCAPEEPEADEDGCVSLGSPCEELSLIHI